ncbi:MAG: HepT-like ribonuclease domain-containing protein [Candidatus Heimdallarchaeaceae archaeon]
MNELASKLQEYLTEERGKDNITIENFEKINLGYETAKYSFTEHSTVDKKTTESKFVLRMLPNVDECYGAKNAKLPWKEIIGMRDKLIHVYFGVNLEVVWKTIHEDIAL